MNIYEIEELFWPYPAQDPSGQPGDFLVGPGLTTAREAVGYDDLHNAIQFQINQLAGNWRHGWLAVSTLAELLRELGRRLDEQDGSIYRDIAVVLELHRARKAAWEPAQASPDRDTARKPRPAAAGMVAVRCAGLGQVARLRR
jgi:hypothetical protein